MAIGANTRTSHFRLNQKNNTSLIPNDRKRIINQNQEYKNNPWKSIAERDEELKDEEKFKKLKEDILF